MTKSSNIFSVDGMSRGEIFEHLKGCMQERGLYEESLDPAILMLAGLMETYQKYFDEVKEERVIRSETTGGAPKPLLNPAFNAMSMLAEQIRKYMRDLGLVVAKPAGFVSQDKDTGVPNQNDKLTTMLGMVARPRMAVYKKTRKKQAE